MMGLLRLLEGGVSSVETEETEFRSCAEDEVEGKLHYKRCVLAWHSLMKPSRRRQIGFLALLA